MSPQTLWATSRYGDWSPTTTRYTKTMTMMTMTKTMTTHPLIHASNPPTSLNHPLIHPSTHILSHPLIYTLTPSHLPSIPPYSFPIHFIVSPIILSTHLTLLPLSSSHHHQELRLELLGTKPAGVQYPSPIHHCIRSVCERDGKILYGTQVSDPPWSYPYISPSPILYGTQVGDPPWSYPYISPSPILNGPQVGDPPWSYPYISPSPILYGTQVSDPP